MHGLLGARQPASRVPALSRAESCALPGRHAHGVGRLAGLIFLFSRVLTRVAPPAIAVHTPTAITADGERVL